MTQRRPPVTRDALECLGFGGATLGNVYAVVPDEIAQEAVRAALDTGVRYFDAAPLYGHGLSETRLGAALDGVARDRFIVSTKVGRLLIPNPTLPDHFGGYIDVPKFRPVFDYSAEATYRALAESLERLRVDRIDIACIHDIDTRTHGADQPARFRQAMDGSYQALERLRHEGELRHIGIGVNETEVCLAAARAGDFDLFLLASRYTLLEQALLDELFPLCMASSLRIVVGGPFTTGILAFGAIVGARYNYRPAPPEIMEKVRRIEAVCGAHGVPLLAAALQFAAAPEAVVSVLPGALGRGGADQHGPHGDRDP